MEKSESIDKLSGALAKFQLSISPVLKDKENPFFHSKFADLTDYWKVCQPSLGDNGLSVAQTMDMVEGKAALTTSLLHNSGQFISGVQPIVAEKNTSQSLGSGITYARRYGLAAILGMVAEDDDGNKSMPPDPLQEKEKTTEDPVDRSPANQTQLADIRDLMTRKQGAQKYWDSTKDMFKIDEYKAFIHVQAESFIKGLKILQDKPKP